MKQYKRVMLKEKVHLDKFLDCISIYVLITVEQRIGSLYNLCYPDYTGAICEEV